MTRHNDPMTATEDLTAWLPAQVDEDERIARKAASLCGCHPAAPVWLFGDESTDGRIVIADDPHPEMRRKLSRRWSGSYDGLFAAEHVARHDPARVRREVEAKRRIMAIHHPRPYGSIYPAVCDGCGYAGSCEDPVTEDINDCPELRILAAIYSDRPGYRDEWRP